MDNKSECNERILGFILTKESAVYQKLTNESAVYQKLTNEIAVFQKLINEIAVFQKLTNKIAVFQQLTNEIAVFQTMGGAMTGMTNHAKKGETDEFCSSVQTFSSSVCGLTEASVQVGEICVD